MAVIESISFLSSLAIVITTFVLSIRSEKSFAFKRLSIIFTVPPFLYMALSLSSNFPSFSESSSFFLSISASTFLSSPETLIVSSLFSVSFTPILVSSRSRSFILASTACISLVIDSILFLVFCISVFGVALAVNVLNEIPMLKVSAVVNATSFLALLLIFSSVQILKCDSHHIYSTFLIIFLTCK